MQLRWLPEAQPSAAARLSPAASRNPPTLHHCTSTHPHIAINLLRIPNARSTVCLHRLLSCKL